MALPSDFWKTNTDQYTNKYKEINDNIDKSQSSWIQFLDGLGWMEASGQYDKKNGNYVGMYQVGDKHLEYLHFLDGLGKQLFDVTTKPGVACNPVAQELAAIMEFSGTPTISKVNPDLKFVSNYTAVRTNADMFEGLPKEKFDKMVGQEFTINYTDENDNPVGSDTIILSKAGISAAAHLVGTGAMAEIMRDIYDECYDQAGNKLHSTATLKIEPHLVDGNLINKYCDGSNIVFSSYVKLLQGKSIDSLIDAKDDTNHSQFNNFAKELLTYRKDKIIDYLIQKKQEVAMTIKIGDTDYRETIRSILQGLEQPTDTLNKVDGMVVLAGDTNTKYSDKSDLIIGLENGNHTLSGGDGKDYLFGGEGKDSIYGGSGKDNLYSGFDDIADRLEGGEDYDTYDARTNDTIKDTDGKGRVFFEIDLTPLFRRYKEQTRYSLQEL